MTRRGGGRAIAGLTALVALATSGGQAAAHPDRDHAPAGRAAEVSGVSTLRQTLVGGDPARGFQFLRTGAGEAHVVREDLARARPGRERRRRSLVYLAQLSDFQVSDEESPLRVEFLDRDPTGRASAAWRPQESLVAHQVEQTIRQVNRFLDSPVAQGDGTRARMLNAVVTGDQADNQQLNETELVLRLLEGGPADPASGTKDLAHPLCPADASLVRDIEEPLRYTGVQDYTDSLVPDTIFYDPADVRGIYAERSWPRYPGLLDRAQEPFAAEGLKVPSYVAFGNHDALAQGNQAAIAPFELIATGCVKPLVALGDEGDPFGSVQDPQALLTRALTERDKFMIVPRDARRQLVDKVEYKALHRTDRQGDAHGFALVDDEELRASDGAASYYSFEPVSGVRYIVLDTVSEGGVVDESSDGNIDDPQFSWLEDELRAAQERDELILVFAHHATGSLTAEVPDEVAPPCVAEGDLNPGCDRDPRRSTPLHHGDDLSRLLLRFPNAVALVAGHSHENRVQPLGSPEDGLWEIKSPAVVDWPTQHRLIEVMDNRDGTLSIFATMLDHAGPATAPGDGADVPDPRTFSPDVLASVGRTLAYNDPQVGTGPDAGENSGEPGEQEDAATAGPRGRRTDRNVELVLRDPRAAGAAQREEAGSERRVPGAEDGRPAGRAGSGGRDAQRQEGAGPRERRGGSLPFTGGDVLLVVAAGAALAGVGARLRRLNLDR